MGANSKIEWTGSTWHEKTAAARGNVVPACNSCNSRKRARPLEDFLQMAPKPKIGLIVDELVMEYLV